MPLCGKGIFVLVSIFLKWNADGGAVFPSSLSKMTLAYALRLNEFGTLTMRF
jgi:hypothetical protein